AGGLGNRRRPVGHQGQGTGAAAVEAARRRARSRQHVCVRFAAPRADRCAGRHRRASPGGQGLIEMKTQMALPGNPSPAEEVRRVRVVRDAIGLDIKLMCDINQRWRVEQAIDIGHRVADVGLFWLEDVTTCDDFAGLGRVNAALSTPIAGGEYLWGIVPFRNMIEARSVDYIMIDLCRVGGVSQWMKVAGMAEAFNLPVVSHVMPEMHLHLVAAVPNGLTVEYMPWMLKLYEETPAIEKGQLVLPQTPGLGLKFNEKAVAAYRVG